MRVVKMMAVKDFMITDVISSKPTDTIKDVMKLLVEKRIGGVPIVDDDGKLRGIVTDGDILRMIRPKDRQIVDYFSFAMLLEEEDLEHRLIEVANQSIMKIARTDRIVTVHPEDDMKKVVILLSKHHFKKLPVIDRSQHVVGVISRGMPYGIFNVPSYRI
ncbi:CBS domain-containing protein [Neobacillus endophyticus]|uniref:CBS domain-containing protein n=1 Tax=Neobacillus endophyticus TaxID=2738405 RepID=UPI001C280D85|nr:CBS domain-containing protein [Neobacillus endophyticus]